MNLFDTLSSFGLTTSVLQVLILGGIALFIIGMYWRIIVAGAAIAFCVAVFAMSPSKNGNEDTQQKSMFMEDCLKYENQKSCNDIWYERESQS